MTEEWRAIPGWEGMYEVSDAGRVRSLDRIVLTERGARHYRGRVLQPGGNTMGYAQVGLQGNGKREYPLVHALVLLAFVGPKPEGHVVSHGTGGRQDNSLGNLSYRTPSDNLLEAHARFYFSCMQKMKENYYANTNQSLYEAS